MSSRTRSTSSAPISSSACSPDDAAARRTRAAEDGLQQPDVRRLVVDHEHLRHVAPPSRRKSLTCCGSRRTLIGFST
jgi:hypothetical protein